MHRSALRQLPELAEVYASQVLRSTGLALISVFVPIYLLTLGYSLLQALLFLMVHYTVGGGASILAGWLNGTVGLKRTALIGAPFTIAYFLSLYALSFTNLHFLVPAVLMGLGSMLHWMPMHCLFTRYSHGGKSGREVTLMYASMHFFQIIAPSVGGIIATIHGYPVLAVAALVIVALSVVPLFLTKDIKTPYKFSWQDLTDLRHHSFVGVTLAEGFSTIVMLALFPLYIYLVLGEATSVGYLKSLDALINTLGILAIGHFLDRYDKRSWLRTGSWVYAIALMSIPFMTTGTGLAATTILLALGGAVYYMSYDSLMYDYARNMGDKGDEFIIVREIFLNVGRVTTLGLAIILPFTYVFPIAAAALGFGAIALRTAPSR